MSSESKYLSDTGNTIIVVFGGWFKKFGGIPVFEFLNFLKSKFSTYSLCFYVDKKQMCYHFGIDGITKNIDDTAEYLGNIIKKYKRVIFMGNSSGAYASILFGSLLKVSSVIAFNPITILYLRENLYDPRYRNLKNTINDSTNYYLYGDSSIKDENDIHHIKHCRNIEKSNVNIIYKNGIDLKQMRDSSELYNIITEICTK